MCATAFTRAILSSERCAAPQRRVEEALDKRAPRPTGRAISHGRCGVFAAYDEPVAGNILPTRQPCRPCKVRFRRCINTLDVSEIALDSFLGRSILEITVIILRGLKWERRAHQARFLTFLHLLHGNTGCLERGLLDPSHQYYEVSWLRSIYFYFLAR